MQMIKLDISQLPGEEQPVLRAKQADVGRKFKVAVTDAGEDFPIPGDAAVAVWYSGTAGEGNYTHIGAVPAAQISGNTVTVELITQMLAVPGGGVLSLALNRSDGTQLGLWNIHYWVEPVPGADSKEAQEYYNAFAQTAAEALTAAEKLTLPIPVKHGGTGAQNAAAALTKLGAAPASHNHSASNITSGVLPLNRGGTGCVEDLTDAPNNAIVRKLANDKNNQLYFTATKNGAFYATEENGLARFGTLPIGQGGTGAANAADALANLGGCRIDLLWTNASVTSDFPPQTLSLGLSGYDMYIVLSRYNTETPNTICAIGRVGTGVRLQTISGANSGTQGILRYIDYVSSGGLKFYDVFCNGAVNNDGYLVPHFIYGIKGVQS